MTARIQLSICCLFACVLPFTGFTQDELDELMEIDRGENEESVRSQDSEVWALVTELHAKEAELQEAKREIARLENALSEASADGATARKADGLEAKDAELQKAGREIARLRKALTEAREERIEEKATLFYNMACIYRDVGQYKKAERDFLKALDVDPLDAATHFNLGILYEDCLNDKNKARKHYEKFLELAPNDKDAPRVVEWLSSLL